MRCEGDPVLEHRSVLDARRPTRPLLLSPLGGTATRGVCNEGRTECYALQAGVEIGQRLGLSEGTARQRMRQQLAENAFRSRTSPAYLVPADCCDGGRLDFNPDSARFP